MNYRLFTIGTIAVLTLSVFFFPSENPLEGASQKCAEKSNKDISLSVECWNFLIEDVFQKEGVGEALSLFKEILSKYPAFSVNCHRSAHRIGDLVYRDSIINNTKPLGDPNLPTTTTLCAYGFFHAFVAATIQNQPEPAAAQKLCEELFQRFREKMPSIHGECYDPVGNGFFLAHAEKFSREKWGDTQAFLGTPLKQCSDIPSADTFATERCVNGVFTLFYETLTTKTYGFSLNTEKPFIFCKTLPQEYQKGCYSNGILFLDKKLNRTPSEIFYFIKENIPQDIQADIFQAGVAAVFQANQEDFSREHLFTFANQCTELEDSYFKTCIKGLIRSLFINGESNMTEDLVSKMCNQEDVSRRDTERICINELSKKTR